MTYTAHSLSLLLCWTVLHHHDPQEEEEEEDEEEEEEATARHNQTPSSGDSLQQLRVPSSKRCRFRVPSLHRKVSS